MSHCGVWGGGGWGGVEVTPPTGKAGCGSHWATDRWRQHTPDCALRVPTKRKVGVISMHIEYEFWGRASLSPKASIRWTASPEQGLTYIRRADTKENAGLQEKELWSHFPQVKMQLWLPKPEAVGLSVDSCAAYVEETEMTQLTAALAYPTKNSVADTHVTGRSWEDV